MVNVIDLIMVLCTSSRGWRTKKILLGGSEEGKKGSIDEIYTPVFRARAGSNSVTLFFINNRV
jgi:hypothetical protein